MEAGSTRVVVEFRDGSRPSALRSPNPSPSSALSSSAQFLLYILSLSRDIDRKAQSWSISLFVVDRRRKAEESRRRLWPGLIQLGLVKMFPFSNQLNHFASPRPLSIGVARRMDSSHFTDSVGSSVVLGLSCASLRFMSLWGLNRGCHRPQTPWL